MSRDDERMRQSGEQRPAGQDGGGIREKLLALWERVKLMKFALISFSSFLIDYALFTVFTVLFGTRYLLLDNILARVLSASYNYTMNCTVVFRQRPSVKSAGSYAALAGGILLLNNVFLELYTRLLHIPVYPAKVLTEVSLFLISYTVQKYGIFRKKEEKEEKDGENV